MRVISGKYRGRKIASPVDNRVRPTSDRIKETVFNILSNRLAFDGAEVLDLFAGSGSLGLEALSRGAKSAVFIDRDPDSVKLIRQNLKNVTDPFEVYQADYRVALKKLAGKTFDLVFLDPPYSEHLEFDAVRLLCAHGLLKKGGVIFIEHDKANKLPNLPECFIIDTRECGNTCISFLFE